MDNDQPELRLQEEFDLTGLQIHWVILIRQCAKLAITQRKSSLGVH